jgi:beta-lactamase superfamily II metal-dependent hydrolase
MKIQFLPAGCGDAIIIQFDDSSGEKRLIVVDFGKKRYADQPILIEALRTEIKGCKNIDLFVITHMDDDHIGGVVSLFEKEFTDITDKVNEWWLNHSLEISNSQENITNKINAPQAVDLKEFLTGLEKCPKKPILAGQKMYIGDAQIEVLSPDIKSYNKAKNITLKEEKKRLQKIGGKISDHSLAFEELQEKSFELDNSITNRSSIAFIIEIGYIKGLFLADSHPDIIEKALKQKGYHTKNKIKLDFVKVSHHGSRKNTSPQLLELLECSHYVISSNGRNGHELPDKEALFRIARTGTKEEPITLYFTHSDNVLRNIFSTTELSGKYHFNTVFTDGILTYPFHL